MLDPAVVEEPRRRVREVGDVERCAAPCRCGRTRAGRGRACGTRPRAAPPSAAGTGRRGRIRAGASSRGRPGGFGGLAVEHVDAVDDRPALGEARMRGGAACIRARWRYEAFSAFLTIANSFPTGGEIHLERPRRRCRAIVVPDARGHRGGCRNRLVDALRARGAARARPHAVPTASHECLTHARRQCGGDDGNRTRTISLED